MIVLHLLQLIGSVSYYRKWKLISSEVGVKLKNRENSKFSKKIKLWSKFTRRTCVLCVRLRAPLCCCHIIITVNMSDLQVYNISDDISVREYYCFNNIPCDICSVLMSLVWYTINMCGSRNFRASAFSCLGAKVLHGELSCQRTFVPGNFRA